MSDPSPRAPFDQGLFLAHFNKGKEYYDQRRLAESERELEEAYLLRPRDSKVLNLLGLIYFRQDKFEKAEEVYRKLVSQSPEASTLFYNLGLIYFKLGRFEEAESAFVKALELSPDGNPKINFYLGSIYEKLRRFQDAIFQYRQAGAHLMVRRVEDKIASGSPPVAPAKKTGSRHRSDVDTAEFKVKEVREAMQRAAAALAPVKTIQPVSETIFAEGAPRPLSSDTDRFRLPEALTPPAGVPRPPDVLSFPPRTEPSVPATREVTRPLKGGTETFHSLGGHLMEVNFTGKVFIKQGTIYSYGGNLTFWVKDRRPGGLSALVIVTGSGKLILTDKEREITFLHVDEETIYVEPQHLLACEETLTPRYVRLEEDSPEPEFLVLEGRGMVALSVASKPLTLAVTPDLPVSVPSASVIMWNGRLHARVIADRQIYEVMHPPGPNPGPLIRLEGDGRILVEQV